jgi:hypothetical protein
MASDSDALRRAAEKFPCCLRDADAIDAAGWVSPDTHRRAVEEAREDERAKAARRLAGVEAERDDHRERANSNFDNALMWRARAERAEAERDEWREICSRQNTRLAAEETRAEQAAATVERVRALLANNPDARSFGRGDIYAALDGAPEQDGGRVMAPTYVCDGCMQHITTHDVATWADHEHVLCRRCDQRKRDGGE